MNRSNPRFPIYIVSKGRHDSRYTVKTLERMKVPYFIVIEEKEYDSYASVIDKKKILILDSKYQIDYDAFDALGMSKSKGPGPARNFAWDHSIKHGYLWHWVMDDNIHNFYRFNRNSRIKVNDGTIFFCMEEFCLRYENIAMAGPHYRFFVTERNRRAPFILNTRIYSCNLIRNDVNFRWRGRYNEDTDLSLRMLKAGYCTVQFSAFLQGKIKTQILKGGNTEEFYSKEGTLPKSHMLIQMHPDISEIKWKFNRWHHYVNYKIFKQSLLLKENIEIIDSVNNYGMMLKHEKKEKSTGTPTTKHRSRTGKKTSRDSMHDG